jgi:hypothetical protein
MTYETPRVTDCGSIGQHAFVMPGDTQDHVACPLDAMFGEYSCGEHS